jgi:predicted NBD/HSP70 family sugar kinase
LAVRLAADRGDETTLLPPFDPRAVFDTARSGDVLAGAVVEEEARRIALHIVPLAAVADLALVVLGGGIGTNGDLLLQPVRRFLGGWLPYPPRVEISSLGEAAVLTGALAVGRRSALDSVFVNRSSVPA